MTSVLLVFQLGQPRIWMSMSRDGLLPKAFSKVHPRFGTPSFATIVTGLLVGIPIFFIDLNTVVDLCSIGTLFAFILVCGGVLMLHNKTDIPRKFKVPYINGQFIVPLLFIVTIVYIGNYAQDWANENANPFSSVDAIPMFIFFIVFATLSFFAIKNKLSLIPVLGILSCLYLMAQIHVHNWIGFTVWLLIGLVIYFLYL
jgi:amino acid transporter